MPKRAIIPRTPPTDAPTMAPVDRELSLDVGKDSGNVVAGVVALGTPNELVEDKPSIGGKILNAGERWTLLELESSVILNWYCWVVGMSDGITSVAMPVFWSVAVWQKLVRIVLASQLGNAEMFCCIAYRSMLQCCRRRTLEPVGW